MGHANVSVTLDVYTHLDFTKIQEKMEAVQENMRIGEIGMIRLAEMTDLERVLQITHDTISEIYSHYYAEGVVQFFLEHHSRENVLSDIEDGIVWLMEEEDGMIGT